MVRPLDSLSTSVANHEVLIILNLSVAHLATIEIFFLQKKKTPPKKTPRKFAFLDCRYEENVRLFTKLPTIAGM